MLKISIIPLEKKKRSPPLDLFQSLNEDKIYNFFKGTPSVFIILQENNEQTTPISLFQSFKQRQNIKNTLYSLTIKGLQM